MGTTTSNATQTLHYDLPPAVVAEACQSALRACGSVQRVSRETGIIEGKVNVSFWNGNARISIRVAKSGEGTEVHIQTSRSEVKTTSGGAEKGMSMFIQALANQPSLKGASNAGW